MKKSKLYIKVIIVFLLFNIGGITAQAQQETEVRSMIISNSLDEQNLHVKIKWFIPEIYVSKGVNIYRRTPGQQNWDNILEKPFKKGDYIIPNNAFLADSTLDDYISFIDELSLDEIQGLTKAMILVKGIQNYHYAKYIGIEYHDSDVKLGEEYQYKVTKLTASGEKELNISRIITVQKHILDSPPEEIEIKSGDEKVLLKWKPNKFKFYGANIFRRSESQSEFEKMNEVPIIISKRKGQDGVLAYPDIFFTDDSLSNGTTYFYKIVGLDYFGRSSKYSKIFEVTPKDQTAPPSPKFLKNTVDLLNVKLSWENTYGFDIEGINIYRSKHHDVGFKLLNMNLLNSVRVEYVDIVEKPGKYYYYVAAVDSSGNEGKSFMTMANVLDIYPPEKPQGLYTESDTGRISLHWKPNKDEDLMGYQVFRTVNKDSKNRYVLLNSTPFMETNYIDSLPKSAKNNFYYRVTAVDSSYNRSEYSDFAMNFMPDVVPPAQPFIKDVVITKDNYLQIKWIPNADLDLKGYNIFRETVSDTIVNKKKLNESILDPVVKHFTDRWVEQNTKYNYYLIAMDSSGNSSQYSNPFPGKLPKKNPEIGDKVIKFINVKNKGKYNQIRWEINPEDGYLGVIVYRKEEGGVFRPLTGLMQSNKIKDSNITPGGIYYYEVRVYHESYGESRSKQERIIVPVVEVQKKEEL
ncbi:MAG: hypothetical protein GQ564_06400 [Bacteroidales bacterium]|nr:hypothetical protein [Bacteroidales bacterium]